VVKLDRFQLYCMLLITVAPVAFLEQTREAITFVANDAWLAFAGALLPGLIVAALYTDLLKNSRWPFPRMLEEHLGKWPGKLLGLLYVPFFILVCAYTLRVFTDFIETNVLPGTPISVFIVVLLLVSFLVLKIGLNALPRVCVAVTIIGLPFSFLIGLLALGEQPDWGNLLPLGYMQLSHFFLATTATSAVVFKVMPVLTLGFFVSPGEKPLIFKTLFQVVISYVLLMVLLTVATIVNLGGEAARFFSFPAFSAIRLISIGRFIQNIDIVFIGIWILGIFAVLALFWFMMAYTTQECLGLSDYRFLLAPSALIIGVLAVQLAPNIIVLEKTIREIIPASYLAFFLVIPLLTWVVMRLKRWLGRSPGPAAPAQVGSGSE
jgi:spore germination protein KB